MNQLVLSRIEEISVLHSANKTDVVTMIERAIRIGELLSEQKSSMKHGEWIPWVEENLPFLRQQAGKYIRAFTHRRTLNGTSTFHLEGAISFLANPRPAPKEQEEPCGEEGEEDVVDVEFEEVDDDDLPTSRININELAEEVRGLTRKAELLAGQFVSTRIIVRVQSKESRKYVGQSYNKEPVMELLSEIRKMEKVLLIGERND